MRLAFFLLLILLIVQIGFWHALAAVVGAALMFVLLIPLFVVVAVLGGVLVLAAWR